MATTYNNLYLDTRARLKRAGVESAQLEAREIICYAADKSREQFYRDMTLYVSGGMERRVEELVQRRSGQVLTYHMTGESGPDHNKTFLFEVRLNGEHIGQGEGRSKKEAEQAAARSALDNLKQP